MKITGLSASSYSTFSDCRFKYYLTQVLGFSDEPGSAAVVGTLCHHILEILSKLSILKHDKKSKLWNVDYLWKICYNHYSHIVPAMQDVKNDKLIKVCKGLHDLINGPHTPVRDNTIDVEVSFNIAIKEPGFVIEDSKGEKRYLNIRGRIDRVDLVNRDTIMIYDYKSGTRDLLGAKVRKKKDATDLWDDIQCRMYHLAAKTLYPFAKNIIVTFVYFADGGAICVPFDDSDIQITKELIRRRFETIKTDNEPQRTISWKCKSFCGHGKNGTCNKIWAEAQSDGFQFTTEKYVVLNQKFSKPRKY